MRRVEPIAEDAGFSRATASQWFDGAAIEAFYDEYMAQGVVVTVEEAFDSPEYKEALRCPR